MNEKTTGIDAWSARIEREHHAEFASECDFVDEERVVDVEGQYLCRRKLVEDDDERVGAGGELVHWCGGVVAGRNDETAVTISLAGDPDYLDCQGVAGLRASDIHGDAALSGDRVVGLG